MCGGGVAPLMQKVGYVVVEGDIIVCLLVLSRLCYTSGIVFGLPVGGPSKLMGILEEEDGGIHPFRPSFRSIECTLLALAATPLQWNDSMGMVQYLFHVVYKTVCAPPPISLV